MGILAATSGCAETVTGELLLRDGSGPAEVIAPSECLSGEDLLLFGVDMFDEDEDWMIRFFHDPLEGPVVQVFPPSDEAPHLFTPDVCTEFRGELRRREVQDEDRGEYGVMYGSLRLQCEALGTTLEGKLDFEDCDE